MGFLTRRSLVHYWRSNVAVVLGVATAVTVLAGALLVGNSVRGSLRDLVLQRLGRTSFAVVSQDFFREALARDLRSDPSFSTNFADTCPIVVVQGLATNQATGQRSLGVQVYGVDDRFWRFHQIPPRPPSTLGSREVLLSAALARDIGAEPGSTVLLRIQKPSDIPLDSLHGRKDDVGSTIRLTFGGVMQAADLGDFSLQPQQGDVRAAFVPLLRLQQDLGLEGRVNAMLVSTRQSNGDVPDAAAPAALEGLINQHATLDDLGLQVRSIDGGALSVETRGTLIDRAREDQILSTAVAQTLRTEPVFTYLVNSITAGDRTIPYSLVTAISLDAIAPRPGNPSGGDALDSETPPIVLNEWTARELRAAVGDKVSLDYLVWEDPGVLASRTTNFVVSAVVPLAGAAADRTLVPFYPGVTDSTSLRDWNPPFPIDLRRIRPADEEYWRNYRTTPKAFIPVRVGQTLWQSRHGSLTSIRILPAAGGSPVDRDTFVRGLRTSLDPVALGLAVRNVRADGIGASRGATDFGEYFTYFSFFLVVSALLLAVLFFKLGIEQRAREVGLLRAVGFTASRVRRLFVVEGLALSVAGSVLGVAGAIGYGALMMLGLRTWWVESVGTTSLTLHVSPVSLSVGMLGGIAGAVVSIWWTLRSLRRISERSLLAGKVTNDLHAAPGGTTRIGRMAQATGVLTLLGLLLMGAGGAGVIDAAGAFFGAGASLLAACLCGLALHLRRPARSPLSSSGRWPLARLGVRNASYRPGRSVLSVAVVASAAFVLISVGAFRREADDGSADRKAGTGGFALMINTLLPIVNAPDSPEGRDLMGLANRPGVSVTAFRVRPGDDTSCLNLYEPREPRIVGVGSAFVGDARFSFQSSLATTDADRQNPWRLLEQRLDGGVIPAIADANSMTYVLHKSVGDELVVSNGDTKVRLRFVAALRDSLLQGEVLISDANFITHFPSQPGYQLLLVDAPAADMDDVAATIEDRLSDFGADAVPAAARLAEFHRVENTYLSTFQTLGGLGLLLGTVGLATVLLRNVLERRRELALLSAVGYRRSDILTIVMAENAFLLTAGLVIGAACAIVAVAPAALERGGRIPAGTGAAILLVAVLAMGLLSSLVATRATLRTRLLTALKAE